MLIVNKTMNEVGFIIDDYNGFTEHKEEELAKLLKNLKVKNFYIWISIYARKFSLAMPNWH